MHDLGDPRRLAPALDDDDFGESRKSPPASAARLQLVAGHVRAILEAFGADLADPHLAATPDRVARGYEELFSGLDRENRPTMTKFPNPRHDDQAICVADLPFYTLCAHHLLPVFGHAHISYVPGKHLVGLSKLARAIDFLAHRPQLQERLTDDLADFLVEEIQPRGVLVVLQARHLCMEMRGVAKPGAITTTSSVRGILADPARRAALLPPLPPGTGRTGP